MLRYLLEAQCDDMHICIGSGLEIEALKRGRGDHEIAAPGMHASATLTYSGTGGTSHQVKVSDRHICVIPAGQTNTVHWSSDAPIMLIAIKPHLLRQLARVHGCHGHEIVAQYTSVDPFLWHMARTIEQQLLRQRSLDRTYVEAAAVIIGQHLLCHYGDAAGFPAPHRGLPRYKIRRAVDYIQAHHREEIGFKDIAEQLDMSPFHFARMFKQAMCESPQQFIMRCRIESAKKLLIESEKSIADIAFEVGYKSQSYFTTRFALLVGATPAAFRSAR